MDDSCELQPENEDSRDPSGSLHTVLISRGEKGYGLTVSGESPVIVQDVREGGPAHLAGVRKGDSIIKVNDTLVSKVNHTDVVKIIKSSDRVKLTLKTTAGSNDTSIKIFSQGNSGGKSSDLITPPLPVTTQVQNRLEENKVKMLQKFLEKQKKTKENVLLELSRGPSRTMQRRLENELESINRQINLFMEELRFGKVDDTQSNSSGSDSSRHNRVKSSPDPLGFQSVPGSNRHSGCDMTGDISLWSKASTINECDTQPPGTPPPAYLGPSSSIPLSPEECGDDNYCSIADESSSILTMEEEDGDVLVEDHGPFNSLNSLMKHNAYLSVFVNYVLSNCDCSSLFFYMITDLYREGGAKERKKWAYEIHSSFLLPGAPLRLSNIDESVLYEIDETLQKDLDKEEILKKLFWKARHRSKEDLNEQLADFRCKRSAGLGTLFGPSDSNLKETINNKTKELEVVEKLLVPVLDTVSEDLKNQTDQTLIVASSLATILWKYFNIKSQRALNIIDRCPLFVNKDRPLRSKILRGNKKQVVRDHSFNLVTYYSVNHCNHCGVVIWGVAPQGYQCACCEMNIHKSCVKHVEETCVGQVHKNERTKDTKLSSFLSKIRQPDEKDKRKTSYVNLSQFERSRKPIDEDSIIESFLDNDGFSGEKCGSGAGGKDQRRSDPASGGSSSTGALTNSHNGGADDEGGPSDDQVLGDSPTSAALSGGPFVSSYDSAANSSSKSQNSHHKKRSSSAINRSESCKEKHTRKPTRETRKNSDPNIPSSKSGDVDGDGALTFHSESSSNSSLSQNQDSPPGGNSAEQVQAYAAALDSDSDIEADPDLPDWTQRLSPEVVERLSGKDRKRQDTINELFHTEQSHVRVLKVLQYLFHQPLRQSNYVSTELLDRLFPNLDQMLKFHTSFNKAMKKRRQEAPLVSTVGDILTAMFDGDEGTLFQQAAGEFVASHGYALESLKQQQKRDQKLANFLQDQENHQHCRRLQLKDMLPAGFQRLSKYPLLLESLLSYTDRTKLSEEYDQISKALERSKEILAYVNAAVQDAENNRRLRDIQKRLDQSSLIKNKHGKEDVRVELDLTKHNLIYEGALTWKTRGQKNIDLHALLLEEGVVLLQKDNEKFLLRYHSTNKSLGKEGKDDNRLNHSPIIKFGTFLFRPVATDKCAFFLVLTQSTLSAQIYELVAMSPNEAKMWLKHLHDAQSAYDARSGRRPPAPTHLQDADEPTTSDPLRGVDDGEEPDSTDGSDLTNSSARTKCEAPPPNEANSNASLSTTPSGGVTQPNLSSGPDSTSKKSDSVGTGAGLLGSALGGPGQMPPGSQGRSRRLQEVQIIQIVEGSSLIQPSEVKISQGVVLSAEPVLTPIELLRRKDLKIREELEEKQNLIADILSIPREHFDSVADMAGDVGLGNKEPRELVLGSIYQAKKLQEALNEAQTIRESDIMAAQACSSDTSRTTSLPLYPAPMEKLLRISATLTQLLNSLLSLVSERDDERDRMRKELVASRERLHQLHMQQNKVDSTRNVGNASSGSHLPTSGDPLTSFSPPSSRPSSFISVGSSVTDQTDVPDQHPDVDDDCQSEDQKGVTFSQNINSESNLSKCYDTSDCDTGLSQTSISEESEVLRVSSNLNDVPLTSPIVEENPPDST